MAAKPDGGTDTTTARPDTGADTLTTGPEAGPDTVPAKPDAGADLPSGPPAVRFIGRVDRSDPAGPRFSWPGTTVVARFTGPSIGVRLRDPGNFFQVSVDGMPQPVLAATSAKESYPIATGLA